MRSSARENRKLSHGPKPTRGGPTEDRLRILVVEDNASNRRIVSLMLESEGFAPETAQNGLEALEMMERRAYDVVFLDVQMPGMDGLQTVREARRRWPRSRP